MCNETSALGVKKIITMLLIAVLSFSSAFAYTQSELDAKKTTYKKVLKVKFADKLNKISETKLKKLNKTITIYITKYKNKNISDAKKLKYIAILTAFQEIINKKLEDEYSVISNIFDEVDKKIELIVISDKRCGIECNTAPIIDQLKEIDELKNIEFKVLDFDEEEAKSILKKNGITKLPAVLLNDNSIETLKSYLEITKDGKYILAIGAKFDPYAKMSDKGFKVIDKYIIKKIKNSSYIKGNKNSEILWLEYSDMECPFCGKLHNQGTQLDLEKKYSTKLSYSLQHFPLDFHRNAMPAAQILECLGKQKGNVAFFELEKITFKNNKSDKDFMIEEAVKLGADKTKLETCFKNNEFKSKIKAQQSFGTSTFGITGTPGNVLINTKTGEYKVISGAYPTATFIETIDKLLK